MYPEDTTRVSSMSSCFLPETCWEATIFLGKFVGSNPFSAMKCCNWLFTSCNQVSFFIACLIRTFSNNLKSFKSFSFSWLGIILFDQYFVSISAMKILFPPYSTPCLIWHHSHAYIWGNKHGHLLQQNGDFIYPIIQQQNWSESKWLLFSGVLLYELILGKIFLDPYFL